LRRIPEPVGQQARWIGFLEEFEYDICHRAGNRHANADAMSRRPCRSRECRCSTKQESVSEGVAQVRTTDQVVTETAAVGMEAPTEFEWSHQGMTEAQTADSDIGPIINLLQFSDDKPPWNHVASCSEAMKILWNQWERLILREDVLYRKYYNVRGEVECYQLVVPFNQRSKFIELAHSGVTGGHLGRRRTEDQVRRRAYWPGWTRDVARYLRSCRPCAAYHRGAPPRQAAMQTPAVGAPFERISVDITGPFPRSARGHVYMVTVMDQFTKWAEAIPLRNHTAETVARALMQHVFSRFGFPLQLLTDRGAEFEGQLFSELCRHMEIDKLRTTAYRPATNGMVERYHRTLNSILGKIVSENQRDWCERVPVAAAAYRASVHEATGHSPNMLVLGREVAAPLDVILGVPPGGHRLYDSYDEFVESRQRLMRETYATVRENLGVAAVRRKRGYDVRVRPQQFRAGDEVWYFYPRRYAQRSPKWQSFYTGPYTVTRIIPPSNAVIRKGKKGTPFVVHLDKLKRCYSESDPAPDHAPEPVMIPLLESAGGTPSADPIPRRASHESNPHDITYSDTNSSPGVCEGRPRRAAPLPARLRDYVL